MGAIFSRESIKTVVAAIILIGIVVFLFGLYQFITASQGIENNYAYQFRSQNTSVQEMDQATGRVLMIEDMKLRDLQRTRNEAAIITGAGVILIAGGWLGADMLRGRMKARPANAS